MLAHGVKVRSILNTEHIVISLYVFISFTNVLLVYTDIVRIGLKLSLPTNGTVHIPTLHSVRLGHQSRVRNLAMTVLEACGQIF